MPDEAERAIVHLIEPQHLFVQALIEVFTEAGLSVDYVGTAIDPRRIVEERPGIIFIDTDFVPDSIEAVRLVHMLAPGASVVVYTSGAPETVGAAFMAAGAEHIIEKTSDRRAIVLGLHEIERRRRQRRHKLDT